MSIKRTKTSRILWAALLLSVPAFAGITNGATSDVTGVANLPAAKSGGGELGDAIGVVIDGPASADAAIGQKSYGDEPGIDPNAKSLIAFSSASKFGGGWDWDWDWWDWDWEDQHGGGEDCGTVVPEPASMALMGLGLSALALRRRFGRR